MSYESKHIQIQHMMTKNTFFSLTEKEVLEYGEAHFNCFIVIVKGSVKCSYAEPIILNKGDLVVLSCEHSLRLIGNSQLVTGYIVQFRTNNCCEKIDRPMSCTELTGKTLRLKPFSQIVNRLQRIYTLMDDTSHEAQIEGQIVFLQIIGHILQASKAHIESGDATAMVKISIDHIHQHYMQKLNVEQLSQNASISVRQYLRIFKKITGETPIAYINQFRIYRAQELLLQKEDSVRKIAADVGFEDVNYFNRLFKQKVGCAPKEYIRLKQSNSRIVTLHYAGELLALGIQPIADLKTTLLQVYQLPQGIEEVGQTQCDIEKLKDLHPDIVILSDSIELEVREEIEKFVPIICIPWDMDPITRLQQIAKVLGKSHQVGQYITTYEQKRKEIKSWCMQQSTSKTTTILRLDENSVWIHAARFFPLFYEIMPFKPSQLMLATTESDEKIRRYSVSIDRLSTITSDRLYIVLGIEEQFTQWLHTLQQSKEWQRLEAVQKDEVYILTQQGIANSIYNLHNQLQEVPSILNGTPPIEQEGLFIGKLSQYIKKIQNE